MLIDYARMCKSYGDNCVRCGIQVIRNKNKYCTCEDAILKNQSECEKVIKDWVKEHPGKTYLDDFKEKYPKDKFPNAWNSYGYPNMNVGLMYDDDRFVYEYKEKNWDLDYLPQGKENV